MVFTSVQCAFNVNMSFEDFRKAYENESRDIELVAIAVREWVNTRNRFIWISNVYFVVPDAF